MVMMVTTPATKAMMVTSGDHDKLLGGHSNLIYTCRFVRAMRGTHPQTMRWPCWYDLPLSICACHPKQTRRNCAGAMLC